MQISAAIQLKLISCLCALSVTPFYSHSRSLAQLSLSAYALLLYQLWTGTRGNYKTRSAARKSAQLRKGVTNKYANKNGKIPGYTQCFSKVSKHYAHHDYNVRGSAKRA